MDFTFLEVNDSELLEKVFAFRYKVITTSEMFKDYVIDKNFINNKESDLYDPYSIHFVALNHNKDICANIRLIYNCPHGYPTENCMIFDKDKFERDKLGELSRIFIDKEYRDIATTKEILFNFSKLVYVKMKELGIEYTYGAVEASFIRLLRISKMHYETLGKKQLHGKMGFRYPCILYTKRLGDDNPELIELWEKKYEI